MNRNVESADRLWEPTSFWKVVTENRIEIPSLQRDYIQGKSGDPNTVEIRDSLLSALMSALKPSETGSCVPLQLSFIYGATRESADRNMVSSSSSLPVFVPVDGQQRLTTLFLLHWYVFVRTQDEKALCVLRNGFSYQTRDTSKRFCEQLCAEEETLGEQAPLLPSADDKTLSSRIRNRPWFTGNFAKDITIQSMLDMLDAIHAELACQDSEELHEIAEKLKASECPVSFTWIPMSDTENINDLYIKVNSRGKLLSDLDLFKAKLEGSKKLMPLILGPDNTAAEKARYFAKYNNEFADLFFETFGTGSKKSGTSAAYGHEEMMMRFLREMTRDAFCVYAEEKRIPHAKEVWRAHYSDLSALSANRLFRMMEDGNPPGRTSVETADGIDTVWGDLERDAVTEAMAEGIRSAASVLEQMVEREPDSASPTKWTRLLKTLEGICGHGYSEKDVFMHQGPDADGHKGDAVRFGTYAYLDASAGLGFPENEESIEAYKEWRRFLWNLLRGREIKTVEFVPAIFSVLRDMISRIRESAVSSSDSGHLSVDETAVLKAITDTADTSRVGPDVRIQLAEEKTKAALMLKSDAWKTAILEAEEYFDNGQIGFLLEFSETKSGEYDLSSFEKYFDASKFFFTTSRELQSGIGGALFERALLAMHDRTDPYGSHLLEPHGGFLLGKNRAHRYAEYLKATNSEAAKNARLYLKRLLDRHHDGATLDEIVKEAAAAWKNDATVPWWKKAFIDASFDLFGIGIGEGRTSSNRIHVASDGTTWLLSGAIMSSLSMDLDTIFLAQELSNALRTRGAALELHPAHGYDAMASDGSHDFPLRYLSVQLKNGPEWQIGSKSHMDPKLYLRNAKTREVRTVDRDKIIDAFIGDTVDSLVN